VTRELLVSLHHRKETTSRHTISHASLSPPALSHLGCVENNQQHLAFSSAKPVRLLCGSSNDAVNPSFQQLYTNSPSSWGFSSIGQLTGTSSCGSSVQLSCASSSTSSKFLTILQRYPLLTSSITFCHFFAQSVSEPPQSK
jgi:hypothetical protein